jgi:hypothetical protein
VPSFTTQVPNLHLVGPIVQLQIAVGAAAEESLKTAGKSGPAPIPALGMIDTGATGSVVRQGLLAPLGLHPIGITFINTPSSTNVACNEYLVRLLLPNNVVFETTIIEAPLQGQHIQCLLGRDMLAHGVLIYVGYANQFTLSF